MPLKEQKYQEFRLNGIPLSANLLYFKHVLYWPEDDRLRSKHVDVM